MTQTPTTPSTFSWILFTVFILMHLDYGIPQARRKKKVGEEEEKIRR